MQKMSDSMKNSKIEVFENSGHCPFIDEPELFATKVIAFAKEL